MVEEASPEGTKVLHLIEPPRTSGGGRESSLFAWTALRDVGLVEHGAVVLVGDSMSERWARAHGIGWDERVAPPTGRVGLAWSSIARVIQARRPETVRCWSAPTLRLVAGISRFHRASIRATLVEGPEVCERLIMRSAARIESVEVFDEEDRTAWTRLGLSARLVDLDDDRPISDTGSERRSLQDSLGVDEDARLLGTLFDHPSDTDLRRFSFLLAILAVSERNTVGLAPAGARLIEAGRRYARAINRDFRVLLSDRPLIEQLRVMDACVIPDPTRLHARGADRLLRRAALRAGVRAFAHPSFAEISGPSPPEMIRPMLDVLGSAPASQERLETVGGGAR